MLVSYMPLAPAALPRPCSLCNLHASDAMMIEPRELRT